VNRSVAWWFVGVAAGLAFLAGCSSSTAVESRQASPVATTVKSAPPTVASTTSPPTAAPTTASTTTSTAAPLTAAECVSSIDLEIRLGQLLFPIVEQREFAAATELAAAGLIAGVVVLGAPDASITDQIAVLQIESLIGPSIVAVDEEGGRVQRLQALVGVKPSARSVATTLTPAQAREASEDYANAVGELGFTMILAPVLDLDVGSYIRDRSFGADPEVVTEYGLAVADGILDANLTPTVKHFPGHGRATDSHLGLPILPPLSELRGSDLLPFAAAAERGDLPIMVAHLVVPGLTGDEPASLSEAAVTGLLRGELGFDGLVMTDAFNMDAISLTRGNAAAAELAIRAGVDLAMLGRLADVEPTIAGLLEAVETGRLDEARVDESFLRVLKQKGLGVCDLPAELAPAIRCQGIEAGGCTLANG